MSISRNIILGVTGSIAAHKAADLASLLTKQKCNVHVVMTADAERFIMIAGPGRDGIGSRTARPGIPFFGSSRPVVTG